MLKLTGVRKFSDAKQLVPKEKVYGEIDNLINDFVKENELPDGELIIKDQINADKVGAQMLFLFREVNKDKAEDDLLVSNDDLYLSKAMSDAIRTGELHTSALKDFVLVEHENNTNGAVYPLMVRPQEVAEDRTAINKLSVGSKTKITKKYERDTVVSTISKFNL